MRKELFLKMEVVVVYNSYFVQKRDATGLLGLSSIQKCIVAIKMLPNSVATDYTHKYCKLSESIALECLKRFLKVIRACFESNYLKQPTLANVKK
jgi:hypothetical protein